MPAHYFDRVSYMNSTNAAKKTLISSYTFTGVVCAVSIAAWGAMNQWQFDRLTAYTVFPLLGLMAFSILWSQYVVLAIAKYTDTQDRLGRYFSTTGWIFLLAIFLHPGLLVWRLWHDGFGLPPESYLRHYVAPGLEWAALLGSVSFLIFLAYELRRWYADKAWWKYIVYATDVAALAIFVHSINLGATVQSGWFRAIWIFYGVTLVACLVYLRVYSTLKRQAPSA